MHLKPSLITGFVLFLVCPILDCCKNRFEQANRVMCTPAMLCVKNDKQRALLKRGFLIKILQS